MGEIYQTLTIKGNQGKRKVRALIDTGANINVLSYKFAKKIYLSSFLERQFKNKIETVNVTNTTTISGIFIYGGIIIGGEERATTFFVTKKKFGVDCLIGVILLQQYQGYVDFIDDKIKFRKMSKRKGKWF